MTTTQINIHSVEARIRPISQRAKLLTAARTLREAAALAKYDGYFAQAVDLARRAAALEAAAK